MNERIVLILRIVGGILGSFTEEGQPQIFLFSQYYVVLFQLFQPTLLPAHY